MKNSEEEIYKQLSNGLRFVHRYVPSPVTYLGMAINVGTRDESEDESGMAHFIEHLLFKGTESHKSSFIVSSLESRGGELNAYTTKEETFVYATTLKEDYERALSLISDIVFHSVFPNNEIEKEVEVIVDEINSYKDSPSELIYDDFETLIFKDSPLGRNILGDESRLRQYRTEDALKFVARNYTPDKILFFSLGGITPDKVEKLVDKYLGNIPSRESSPRVQLSFPLSTTSEHIRINKDLHQSHAMLGTRAYGYRSEKRLALSLLNNILGGPAMSSKLNLSLREKNGLVYQVESAYTSYSDDGIFSIYFASDKDDLDRSISLVRKELNKLQNTPLSSISLERAKKQLLGQIAIGNENRESYALAMAKSYLMSGRDMTLEEIREKLDAISSKDLQDVANEIFGNLSELIYD